MQRIQNPEAAQILTLPERHLAKANLRQYLATCYPESGHFVLYTFPHQVVMSPTSITCLIDALPSHLSQVLLQHLVDGHRLSDLTTRNRASTSTLSRRVNESLEHLCVFLYPSRWPKT